MRINRLLKKWLPASYSKIESVTADLQTDIVENKQNTEEIFKLLEEIKGEVSSLFDRLDTVQETLKVLTQITGQSNNGISSMSQKLDGLSHEINDGLIRLLGENISHMDLLQKNILDEINDTDLTQMLSSFQKSMDKKNEEIIRIQRETVWAAVFNNTISDSPWLTNRSLSPGRWALGYPALYILYRVLEQFAPHHILELGLGQSTKLITQYVKQDNTIEHFVVEHDSTWIDFFQKTTQVSSNTHIFCLDREYISYKDATQVRVYKDFKNTFEQHKFDFIIVDAPLGGDMQKYSRIDILSLLEKNLCEEFVLILDDTNRLPEKNTMQEICNQLTSAGISYNTKIYHGEKDTCIWASPTWSFLCSL